MVHWHERAKTIGVIGFEYVFNIFLVNFCSKYVNVWERSEECAEYYVKKRFKQEFKQ